MRKRRFIKFKILLDEALSPRQSFPQTNKIFNVRHIKHDLGLSGFADPVVYEVACELKRLIVTPNIKDFRRLLKSNKTGIIGISMALSTTDLDKKLCSLLKKSKKGNLFGKINEITGETGKK